MSEVSTFPPAKTISPRTNWAGNLAYGAERFPVPNTVEEAQEAVRAADKVRVVGSRHCFNDIADTTGTQLSLERLNRVLSVDKAKSQVTVEGGIRYGEIGPYLHEQGYALHNTASLPHISIVGACATATHGSGALGNLAVAVAAIEFIDGKGDLVAISREADGDSFAGAVVNLGALGVVTRLTLDLQPAFHIRQDVFCGLPWAALESHFDEIMSSGYSVSVFTAWQADAIEQIWVKSTVEPDRRFAARDSLFGALPATVKLHPIASLDAVNCTEQMGIVGPAFDRLPHFRMGLTPASGDELQVEYFVPREHGVAAVRTLRQHRDRLAALLLMGEIRTIAADDLWMSPCHRTPCVAFHFSFKKDWPALRVLLPGLEEALAPFRPRPHWGKMFTMEPERIHAHYPRLADFRELLQQHDPSGKFRNAFVERNIF
jgi:alditol oxidase